MATELVVGCSPCLNRGTLPTSAEQAGEDDKSSSDEELSAVDLSQLKKPRKKASSFFTRPCLQEEDQSNKPQENAEPDYHYEALLTRIYDQLHLSHPEPHGPVRVRVPAPQLSRMGRRLFWTNFGSIARCIGRSVDHLMAYVLNELGAIGSLDGTRESLNIRGRFNARHMESLLRRYIAVYVRCSVCLSMDSMLEKKDRITFLRCKNCTSVCAVENMMKGYRAQTTRRTS